MYAPRNDSRFPRVLKASLSTGLYTIRKVCVSEKSCHVLQHGRHLIRELAVAGHILSFLNVPLGLAFSPSAGRFKLTGGAIPPNFGVCAGGRPNSRCLGNNLSGRWFLLVGYGFLLGSGA